MKTQPAIARSLACSCAALLSLAPATAQNSDAPVEPPAKLAEFREAFEKTVESRSLPARETFATGLSKLATERADAGDYLGAIRARDRRMELLGIAAGPGVDESESAGEIEVDLASGTRSGGGLRFDAKGNKLVGFTKDNQSIHWELSKTSPGVYSVIVTYSCADSRQAEGEFGKEYATGGTFTLEEATNLTTDRSAPLRRTVLSTGGWNKTITRNIGKITITGSRMTLLLSVKNAKPDGMMHLYGIRLVPTAPAGGGGEGGRPLENAPAELATLRAQFRSAISPKTSPIISSYGTRLRTLLESLSAANDLEGAFEVQKEFISAEKLSKDPTLILDAKPGS